MWSGTSAIRGLAAAALLGGAAACGGSQSEQAGQTAQAAEACAPVERALAADASAAALVGAYEVTVIATAGPAAETPDTVRGLLTLTRYPPEQRLLSVAGGPPDPNAEAVLHGTTDLALDRVGAPALGALDSTDPERPGVFVVERRSEPRSIIMRFGAEANRRDAQRFDGGYMVFDVGAIRENGFAGSWRAGVTTTAAEGYFCAVRR